MYEYLVGCFILILVWIILVYFRKDLLKPSLWTGLFYLAFNSILFFGWVIASRYTYVGEPITPSYWHPNTLFDLNAKSGGYGIEDGLFMLFVGAVATIIYELVAHRKIKLKRHYRPHVRALIVMVMSAFIFTQSQPHVNLIWPIIIGTLCGAVALCIERRDLIKHSLVGGFAFVIIYFLAFSLFNIIFPYFIPTYYTLHNLTGVLFLRLPLEEYLYALTFGMLWAPMYEYFHGDRNK